MVERREVREIVLQALFAEDVSGNDRDHIFRTVIKSKFKSGKKNYSFAEKLYYKTLNAQQELDEIIKNHINNWRIDRLATFDKVVLRAAICEFLHFEEIPTKVTINEAIEIAKNFSTTNSGKFINGILDAVLEELTEENKIKKKGRGLIESSIN